MRRIEFNLSGWQPEELALRLHHVVEYTPSTPPFEAEPGKWNLGGANNWWLHVYPGGEGHIHSRLPSTHEVQAALVTILREFFHLTDAHLA